MAGDVHQTLGDRGADRERRAELIRPADGRRDFTSREAKRRLQQKERHWAPIAYGVFLVALLLIFGITYTTYAFSKYSGVILPGVMVDNTSLAGLSSNQAKNVLQDRLASIFFVPIRLTYQNQGWQPNRQQIGLAYRIDDTVREAMQVGRQETFFEQLLDRLPIHPTHSVPLLYTLDEKRLATYIQRNITHNSAVYHSARNASLRPEGDHVVLVPSRPGSSLDFNGTERVIHDALGRLSKQTSAVPVFQLRPVITDSYVQGIAKRVNNFLSHPPAIRLGKRVVVTSGASFVPMLTFKQHIGRGHAALIMQVDPNKVNAYISQLASQIDRPALTAKMTFDGGSVYVTRPQQNGRSMDQAAASSALLKVITHLKPNVHLHFKVTVTQPPVDLSNPASLGIQTLLGTGETNFGGADLQRTSDIVTIAGRLNDVLITPNQDISFNTLVGTGWDPSVYDDQEVMRGGQLVPGAGGGMQQVATTFLRALYASGLKLVERHPHPYRLSWYEPPVGFDAIVTPGSDDLRFRNNTGHYILLQTRVEPIRQELYIYAYGAKLGWKVVLDPLGKVVKTYKHGPPLIKEDPNMAAGHVVQQAFAHDGADTIMQRTITYRNGNVVVDQILTHYQPWRSIQIRGMLQPTATPTPQPTATAQPARPTPTETSAAIASATPTSQPQPSATSEPTTTATR